MGIFQGIDDAVRVAASGLTFGLADQLEGDGEARTAAARQRLGLAGNAINAATMLAGGAGAVKGGIAAVRALPTLAKAAGGAARSGAKAVRNVVHPGVTRGDMRARLNMAAPPSLISRAMSTVKANPWKSAGAAGIVGAGTFGGDASSEPQRPQMHAALEAPTAQAAPPSPHNFSNADALASSFAEIVREAAQPTLADMMASIGESQGGKISLNQLNALGEYAQRTAVKPGKMPAPGDEAARILEAIYLDQYQKDRAEIGEAEAFKNFEERTLQLKKVASLSDQRLADYYPDNQGN
jgi:hypothetical protein